ncbi:MAG TPA: GNAT family N-acetyltransferase [Thermodesulfovibrionales bacterium]|nr:GNAT family N-acetyltransferase [Thermodesulfovibrionales bacterium]
MMDDNLRLRPLSIFDGHFISSRLKDEAVLQATGLSKPLCLSWFSIWWWIKKTYSCSFCIELDSRPIGFIGLYNLIPRKSAEISLVIFDKTMRQNGHGTRAFKLLEQSLQKHSVIRNIQAKVKTDNYSAFLFWKKVGFVEISVKDDIVIMSMDLK